uniref:Cyclin-like domain-containing protein n=1 Tax=viral metagenome TaxID=1070528 RepID=A0A6C0BTM5_9ZZZZ
MNFDELYQSLEDSSEKKIEKKVDCCSDIKNYQYINETISCKLCNKLINNIIDSPEWRFYGSSDSKNTNPTRCGMPVNMLLPDSSVGTSINSKDKNSKVGLYQQWNSMPYKERSKYKVFNEISNVCKSNNLPTIISDTAASLYSIISDTKISRGNNRKGIIAACVFNACKECYVPRSVKELADMFKITPKVLTKGCKNYTEIIRINKINIDRIQNTRSINISDFIERFSYNLNFNENDIKKISIISDLCSQNDLVYDNTPPAMASGCIYLFVKLNKLTISKKDISDKCFISEVTINKCYKKLESNQKFIDQVLKKISFD